MMPSKRERRLFSINERRGDLKTGPPIEQKKQPKPHLLSRRRLEA